MPRCLDSGFWNLLKRSSLFFCLVKISDKIRKCKKLKQIICFEFSYKLKFKEPVNQWFRITDCDPTHTQGPQTMYWIHCILYWLFDFSFVFVSLLRRAIQRLRWPVRYFDLESINRIKPIFVSILKFIRSLINEAFEPLELQTVECSACCQWHSRWPRTFLGTMWMIAALVIFEVQALYYYCVQYSRLANRWP